jgi:hypothetical protein
MIAFRPPGFRVRSRHLVILVVFLAVVVGVLVPLARFMGRLGLLSPQLLFLVAAPWLLGLLVLLIERKSPVKFWAAPLLVSLSAPALVLWLNSVVVLGWAQTPSVPALLATLLINVVLIGRFSAFLRDMSPRCCPGCRYHSMIPLRSFWRADPRTRKTFWCTSCGTAYWRTMKGEWKKERRRTWADLPMLADSCTAGRESKPFDTHARGIAPMIHSRRKSQLLGPDAPAGDDPAEMAAVLDASAESRNR